MINRTLMIVLFCLCAFSVSFAQEPAPAETPQIGPQRPPGLTMPSQEPQPYEKVITKEAKSKKGVFTVHQIKDKYYYEIPKSEFDKEFLWNTRIAKTTLGVGYGGDELNDSVVRWELNSNKVLLREVDYGVVADPRTPISQAVKAANNDAILMSFPVAAFGPNASAVIEVTRLFTTDVFELSARQRLNATTMDTTRSYIDRISPYPENIEVEATHTYSRMPTPAGLTTAPIAAVGGMRPGSATVVLHHSMVKLPEKRMMPRLFDERVGYFTASTIDYSRDEHRAQRVRYINRWRLEKKDPSAELSEPVKPIVYYIDPATPAKWVP